MYLEVDYQPYWVVSPTESEETSLRNLADRKKFFDKMLKWLILGPGILTILISIILIAKYGTGPVEYWVLVLMLAPPILGITAAFTFILNYDIKGPFTRLEKAGRVIDLQGGLGKVFLDGVLFAGDFHLSLNRKKKVLRQANPSLIDAFWNDALNQQLLSRYLQHYQDDAGVLLRDALIERAEAIIEDIEAFAAPLRVEERESERAFQLDHQARVKVGLEETRQFLLKEQLIAAA